VTLVAQLTNTADFRKPKWEVYRMRSTSMPFPAMDSIGIRRILFASFGRLPSSALGMQTGAAATLRMKADP
jgi:hypothetical protein